MISSQPECLQERQPLPPQSSQLTSTSMLGSVNGKKCGRTRMSRSPPKNSRVKCATVPLRSARVMPSSTTRPSTWWNIGVCVASESRRYTLPRHTHVDGRLLLLHDAHLDGRGVGAQQDAAVGVHDRLGHGLALLDDPERVVGGARGVARRRVERREVVVVELDLGAFGDLVAEADEDVLDLTHGLADEVLVAGREGLAGQGDVDALVGQRGGERFALELRLALLHELLELLADEVAALADQRALLGRQARDGAQELRQRALAPQHLDARLLQRGEVAGVQDRVPAGVVDGREAGRSLAQLLQVCVVHGHPSCAAEERRDGSSGAPAARRENS